MIFVREAETGWTFAAAAANKCSDREAASLAQGNGLRVGDLVRGKDRRVDGLAQGNGPRVDGPAQGNGLQVDDPAQGNDLPVLGQAAAMRLGTLVLAKWPAPKVREVARVSAAVVVACEVAAVACEAVVAAVASEVAAVVVVAAAAVVAADGDRILRSSTMSFSSAISPTASAFIASAITAASAPMLA